MILQFFVFLVGAAFGGLFVAWAEKGSFFGIFGGKAICKNCTLPKRGHHMVPVFGYLFAKGRCRECNIIVPFFFFLFEAIFGFALLIVWTRYFGAGDTVMSTPAETWLLFARELVFVLGLGLLALYDFFHQRLPDVYMIPLIFLALVVNIAFGFDILNLILAGAMLSGFFFFQYSISKGQWIGGGDVRFGILLGFMLGLTSGIMAVFLAYIVGAVVAILMIMGGVAHRKTPMPFGVFLALGGFIALLWGPFIYRVLFSL